VNALATVEHQSLTNIDEESALLGAMMTVASIIDPVAA
jgi:hypothetical protein